MLSTLGAWVTGTPQEEQETEIYDPEEVAPDPIAASVAARKLRASLSPTGDDKTPLPRPCDKMGRIANARDGQWCLGEDACVTALPQDFAARSQDKGDPFCWRLVTPPCTARPCPPPQWEDQCAALAGRPWCVPPRYVERYGGPIEIRCSASGPEARFSKGSPTGCWWLEKYAGQDLQRKPGPIHSKFFPNGGPGWFVPKAQQPALEEDVALNWILNGNMAEPMKFEGSGGG